MTSTSQAGRRSHVSKRHQQNRRKSYGRRQHELHERQERSHVVDQDSASWGDDNRAVVDAFAFLRRQTPPFLGLSD
jgi:hypothetical protein